MDRVSMEAILEAAAKKKGEEENLAKQAELAK